MHRKHAIAIVEDNAAQRIILQRLLDADYQITAFDSGEAFLQSADRYSIVLLDIGLPGMDGYQTCRALRASSNGDFPSVIFVSAHDTAPERVAAYEAGGDDYLIKPIAPQELRHKVRGIIDHREKLQALAEQSAAARQLASNAQSSIGELGIVLEFMRMTAAAMSYQAVADQLIRVMHAWGLRGAVQISGINGELQRSTEGALTPLQVSVFASLRDVGQTFEFGARLMINHAHVAVLVENLPVDDPSHFIRLRDCLLALAASTDQRIHGIDHWIRSEQQESSFQRGLEVLRQELGAVAEQSQLHRERGHSQVTEVLETLARSFASMNLTDIQKDYVDDMLKSALDETGRYFEEALQLESRLGDTLRKAGSLVEAGRSQSAK